MKLPFSFWNRESAPPTLPARAEPIVGAVDPSVGRRSSRASAQRLFAAAQSSALDNWPSTPIPPDRYISQQQRVLVARSREQWANNDYARSFVRLVQQNIVGPQGVVLQAQAKRARGKLDTDANDAIEAAWREWGRRENCDITGKLSWRAQQTTAIATCARDGEFIIRIVFGSAAGPWGIALQAVDPQRLPVDYNVDRYGTKGNFIRNGIEFNAFGRPMAYHFSSTADNGTDGYYYSTNGRGYQRIPADEIIHEFVPEMIGFRRGIPWASSALRRLHHLLGFEDAAVQNARASASKMGFIEYEPGMGPECDDDTPLTIDASPLSFHELPDGGKFKEFNPNYPNGEFGDFNKAMLRGAASGMGVAYNNFANDLEGVNFSSIRQGTLDEREHWKELQQWLIEVLCDRVYGVWLPRALLSGRIQVKGRPLPAARIDTYKEVAWQARRWMWIDPRADVEAAVASKNNMLASPGQIIRESGRDPETVWKESASDVRAMIEALVSEGIPKDKATDMVLMSMATGRAPIKAQAADTQSPTEGPDNGSQTK